MSHPMYSWMFFNWYSDEWWIEDGSCAQNDPEKQMDIEKLLSTSLVFDHYPRIDEKDKDEVNVGGIVSYWYDSIYFINCKQIS